MTDLLPFHLAMALDPGDVEARLNDGKWLPLHDGYTLGYLKQPGMEFRRARPRRSRVQEMAEKYRESRGPSSVEAIIETAIRAVCEYLRTKQAEEMAGPCKRSLPETQAVWAARIEREFLGPR